jgi:hypothetical protein
MTGCIKCGAPLPELFGKPLRQCKHCGAVQPEPGAAAAPATAAPFGGPPPAGPAPGAPPGPPFGGPPGGYAPMPPGGSLPMPPAPPGGSLPMPPTSPAGAFGPPARFAPARRPAPFAMAIAFVGILVAIGGVVAGVLAFRGRAGGTRAAGGRGVVAGFLKDARGIPSVFAPQLGDDPEIVNVTIHETHVSMTARRRGELVSCDSYGKGLNCRPDPAAAIHKEDLDKRLFRLKDADFSVVGSMVAHARERAEARSVSHAILERPLPFSADLVWRVYADRATVQFDPKGKFLGGDRSDGTKLTGADIRDYFEQPTAARDEIAKRLSPQVALKSLVLYPDYVVFEAEDPNKKGNVDRYTLRPTGLSPPDPVRLAGPEEKSLDAFLFRLGDVDFTLLPSLVADAGKRLAIEDGKASHVIIGKGHFRAQPLDIRVYVSSARKSGSVEYDAGGKHKRTF